MVFSLRSPFSFPQPTTPPTTARPFSAVATSIAAADAAGAAVIAAGISISHTNPLNSVLSNLNRPTPPWGSISLCEDAASTVTESKTGVEFPAVIKENQRLLGVGLRRKSVMGLKNINVYAFGVYADDSDIKKLMSSKYGTLSVSELKEKKEISEDLMESDVNVTVRLQIVYGRLSIRSVRNAFEESVGSRLQKFGGSDNKELLSRFTSQFRDEYKIPRGSIIDLSRESGYVLRTTIDGNEVGSIQSKLLCRSILNLYIGNDPFDPAAKEDVGVNLAEAIKK